MSRHSRANGTIEMGMGWDGRVGGMRWRGMDEYQGRYMCGGVEG